MEPRSLRLFPLAYHLTLQAYGQWLPGDPRGWHHRGDGAKTPARAGDPIFHAVARELQRDPTATITDALRAPVRHAIASLARTYGWTILAIATTPSHLHAVVTGAVTGVELLRVIREESPPLVAEAGGIDPSRRLWSGGGYFSMVHTVRELERACRYVELHEAFRGERR